LVGAAGAAVFAFVDAKKYVVAVIHSHDTMFKYRKYRRAVSNTLYPKMEKTDKFQTVYVTHK
jgi:predicted P-loop ATPase/GTPase